jgi:mono/diheme cytochrome c family protein/small nuclear ribonucleoprotein (snRNP)-like protein
MKYAIGALLFIGLTCALAQQASRTAQRTHDFLGLGPAPDAAAAERGAKIYGSNCTFCHGMKATGGDTGPDLIRSTVVLHDQKGETVGPVVHNGRPNKGMPAFPNLSDAQLYDLAEFLHMRVEQVANRGTYEVTNVVTGDANAGKAYFNGAGECSRCHTVTGDLAHIASKFSAVDLQQRFLYPGDRADGKRPPVRVTVRMASGETVSGTLTYLDDFVIVVAPDVGATRTIERATGVSVSVEDPLDFHRKLLDRYTDRDMHNVTAYLATLK